MKVYVKAPANMSRAMVRVANALEQYAPTGVKIVQDQASADLLVHHVIGLEAIEYRRYQRCAVIQYCVNSASPESSAPWWPLWQRAQLVWSYYDLNDFMPAGANFYHAPLGIDAAFRTPYPTEYRDIGVITTGFVNGHGQEALEEPTVAANELRIIAVHVGPQPVGTEVPFNFVKNLRDSELAQLYRRARWVSCLRWVEGFEMPGIEGLACGARPIVFDRPDMRIWYGPHAVYVPECDSEKLRGHLVSIFSQSPEPVSAEERQEILRKFNWRNIVQGFWERVL